MTYIINQTKIDNENTTLSRVSFTYNSLSSEINYLTNSQRYYVNDKEVKLVDRSLETNNWEEYDEVRKNSNSSFLNNIPNIKNYGGYGYVANKMPFVYSLAYEPVLQIKTSDTYKIIHSASLPSLPEHLLPIAVRYIDSSGNYYIERPPFQIEVDMRATYNKYRENAKRMPPYKVWIPWTISVYRPGQPELYVFFSHSSLSSLDQLYTNCFLPNVYTDSKVCFSNSLESLHDYSNSPDNIRTNYSYMFNEYMNGGWNLDLSPNIYKALEFSTKHSSYLSKEEKEIVDRMDKDYPLVKLFLNPPKEYIKKHFPKMTARQLEACEYRTSYYHNSKSYKYMFMIMSTFNVDETLEFYRQISELHFSLRTCRFSERPVNANEGIKTFQDIINHRSSNEQETIATKTTSLYHSLYGAISSEVSSSSTERLQIDLGYDTNIIFINYENYTEYHNTKSYIDQILSYIPENIIVSLMDYLSNNKFGYHQFIVYDFETKTISLQETEICSNRTEQTKQNAKFISDLAKSCAGIVKTGVI